MTDEIFQTAITALAGGDKNALRQIYEAYIKLIYVVILDIVKRREDAEDITSEFFIKLIRVAGTYRKGSSHKAWLVQIARNMAIDHMRKSSHEMLELGENDSESDEKTSGVIERHGAKERQQSTEAKSLLKEDMKQAMKYLKPEEKQVIDLKLVGDFKFKEIAEQLGKPIGTVTWLYNEGIKKLRRCLADYEKE